MQPDGFKARRVNQHTSTRQRRQRTSGDGQDGQAGDAGEDQREGLSRPPPDALVESQTQQAPWDFHGAEDQLRDVDVHAETADVQTQAVIDETGGDPGNRAAESPPQHVAGVCCR